MSPSVSVDYAVVLIWPVICSLYTTLLTVTVLSVVWILRKRRSSILKRRLARTLTRFSELEFNVAIPNDTAESRRVSFSRRSVPEFVTNEATTTWKNFYGKQNKSLESSSNVSEANTSRQPVGHLGKRYFEQQYEEVEAFDFINGLANGSPNNINFSQQLASLECTADGKLTAPQNKLKLSAFTEQSKLFRNDFTALSIGDNSGRIDVNFLQQVEKDDLVEIEKDLEKASNNMGCHGPFSNGQNMSEHIEVDLNKTHVVKNYEDMSITDTVHSPVQDVSKSASKDKKSSLNNDWVADKENVAMNPYAAPCETNFAVNEESNQVLVFDGKRLTLLPDIQFLLPHFLTETPQRITIVLYVYDDLPNYIDDKHIINSKYENSGYSGFQEIKADEDEISVTVSVHREDIKSKRKTIHDYLGNICMTQALPTNIIRHAAVISQDVNSTKRRTFFIVFNESTSNISMTETVPAKLLSSSAALPERRRTVVYEDDTANISITQAVVPSNILVYEYSETTKNRKTIVFDSDEDNISMTQALSSNILGKKASEIKTIVFDDGVCNVSFTQALPASILPIKLNNVEEVRLMASTDSTDQNIDKVFAGGDDAITQAGDGARKKSLIIASEPFYDSDTDDKSVMTDLESHSSSGDILMIAADNNSTSRNMFYITKDCEAVIRAGNVDSDEAKTAKLKDKEDELEQVDNFEKKLEKLQTNVSQNSHLSNDDVRRLSQISNKANPTQNLLDLISNFTDNGGSDDDVKPVAVEEKDQGETTEHKRLSVAPSRQSRALSREDLLSNRLALDDSDLADENTRDASLDMSKNLGGTSYEVVKTSNFNNESTSEANLMDKEKISPLKKTVIGEASYMKETKGNVIPTYLKDVSDRIKELMLDLVKPVSDNMPFQSELPDRERLENASTHSTQVQANLTASSQIDLHYEMVSIAGVDLDRISSSPSVTVDHPKKSRSRVCRNQVKFACLKETEIPEEWHEHSYSDAPIKQPPPSDVLVFDYLNPLNNVLLAPTRYNARRTDEMLCGFRRRFDNMSNSNNHEVQTVTTPQFTLMPGQSTNQENIYEFQSGDQFSQSDVQFNLQSTSTTSERTSVDQLVDAISRYLKDEEKISPLKKTVIGEASYMKETKGNVIPTYLKDVSNGIKERKLDLVKPENASTHSTQVQANLTASSQIDLHYEMVSIAGVDLDRISSSTSVTVDHSEKSRSRVCRNQVKFACLKETEMPEKWHEHSYSDTPIKQPPPSDVLVFDYLNPLNNVLLAPTRYNAKRTDEILCGSRGRFRNMSNSNNHEVETVSTPQLTLMSGQSTNQENIYVFQNGDQFSQSDVQFNLQSTSTTSEQTSVDQSVDAISKHLKDDEVNTLIAMRGNKELLQAYSALTLVDLLECENSKLTSNNKKHLNHRIKYSRSPLVNIKGQTSEIDNITALSEIFLQDILESSNSNVNTTKGKKRINRPTKKLKYYSPSKEVTPKPIKKISRNSKPPKVPIKVSPRNTSTHNTQINNQKVHQSKNHKKKSPKTKNTKSGQTITVQQLITDYRNFETELELNKNSEKKLAESRSAFSQYNASFTSSKNLKSMKDDNSMGESTGFVTPHQASVQDTPWQTELMGTTNSNLSETDSGVNVVAKINMLPFMGTHECEWDSKTVADTWLFRLQHGRLRLVTRLAHRHDNATRTRVRGDTPVPDIAVETVQHDLKNPVATLCVRFACETMRYMVAHALHTPCYAKEIPQLLRRCAAVTRVALRWGRAMHDTMLQLCYTMDNDGNISLKVANVRVCSVWDVKMHIELVVDENRAVSWPKANGVRVTRVVSELHVPEADVRRVLSTIPQDWGHAPRTIWRIFRYLKHKTRDDNLILA